MGCSHSGYMAEQLWYNRVIYTSTDSVQFVAMNKTLELRGTEYYIYKTDSIQVGQCTVQRYKCSSRELRQKQDQ